MPPGGGVLGTGKGVVDAFRRAVRDAGASRALTDCMRAAAPATIGAEKLVPLTAEALPVASDNGRTYTIKVRKGIYFTPDPAFKGKPRELIAADHAYGIKRLIDPAIRSPWQWLVGGKIAGADEATAKAASTGRFDYDAPIAGLEVVDRYTLKIRLQQPDRLPPGDEVGHGSRSYPRSQTAAATSSGTRTSTTRATSGSSSPT